MIIEYPYPEYPQGYTPLSEEELDQKVDESVRGRLFAFIDTLSINKQRIASELKIGYQLKPERFIPLEEARKFDVLKPQIEKHEKILAQVKNGSIKILAGAIFVIALGALGVGGVGYLGSLSTFYGVTILLIIEAVSVATAGLVGAGFIGGMAGALALLRKAIKKSHNRGISEKCVNRMVTELEGRLEKCESPGDRSNLHQLKTLQNYEFIVI